MKWDQMNEKKMTRINIEEFPEKVENGIKVYDNTSYENALAILSHKLHSIKASGTYVDEDRQEILDHLNEFLEYKKEEMGLSEETIRKVADDPFSSDLFRGFFKVPFSAPEQAEFKFIDLFAGVGGFRMALQKLGGRCVYSSEFEPNAQQTYLANYGEMPFGDITKESTKSFIPDDFDVLCAGFPCQPFSISGKKKGFEDTRGTLFFDVCQILERKHPSVVFLENVKHLQHHNGGQTLQVILDKLRDLGYHTEWRILNGEDFGVPQNRERIIIIGSLKKAFDFSKLQKMERRPLKEFLDKDGHFEYLDSSDYTLLENRRKQPSSGLIFAGYRNKAIRKAGVRPGTEHLSRVHKQPNRIYSAEGIHPTLPSQETSGRFFILTEDNRVRKLTLNECWRIMGFPDNFIKVSAAGAQYKQLGNSVCVKMIEAIGKEIKNQLL